MKKYFENVASFIGNLFTDSDGNPSSKRIGLFAITFLFVYMTLKSMSPDVATKVIIIDKEVYWGVFSAFISAMGIILIEKKKDKSKENGINNDENN